MRIEINLYLISASDGILVWIGAGNPRCDRVTDADGWRFPIRRGASAAIDSNY